MAGKRDELELYEDRARIAELMHQGITNKSELADRINAGRPVSKHISRQTVGNDIEWLKQQWKESALYDFEGARQQALEELDYLKKTAWNEFNASRNPKITTSTEGSAGAEDFNAIMGGDNPLGDARVSKTVVKEENREGNVAYLQLIERIVERQSKLKGIDVSKVALTNSKGEDVGSVTDKILNSLEAVQSSLLGTEPIALLTEGEGHELDDAESGPDANVSGGETSSST
jgi:hypothetical protein